ncbi:MAG: NUDIX hydrolase [Thermotaleaceae bacterium]
MGYVEDIRKAMGKKALILNSAGIILLNDSREVLLQFRRDTNNWGWPGGYMEPGETFEDTIKREMKEEMKIRPENLRLLGVYSGPLFYHEYPNGDKVYSVVALYTADRFWGEIKPDNKEINRVEFFQPDKIPDNTTKVTKMLLEEYNNFSL